MGAIVSSIPRLPSRGEFENAVQDCIPALGIATVAYVDALHLGADPKDPVRCVTVAALPAYNRVGNVITAVANGTINGDPALDGVVLVVGDRIGYISTTGVANADYGLYSVTALGDLVGPGHPFVLTRTTDADSNAKVKSGMFFECTEGATMDDTGWWLSTADPINLNTTALLFTQFSGRVNRTDADISDTVPGDAKAAGTSTKLATADHVHGFPLAMGGARVPLVDALNVTLDPTTGREFYLVTDSTRATRAITISAGTDGQTVVLWVVNDAAARVTDVTATWVGVTWVGCFAPNLSNRVSQMDRFEFTYSTTDGTWYGTVVHQTKERFLPWANGNVTPPMLGCDTLHCLTAVDAQTAAMQLPTSTYVGQRVSFAFTQGGAGGTGAVTWAGGYYGAGAILPLKVGANAVTIYDGIVRAVTAGTATAVSLSGMQE